MSRLRRLVQPVNWQYAVGELALIVAGIWIALAANDWNEARHRRDAELWALRQLRAAIVTDVEGLSATATALREKQRRIGVLLDHLRRDLPPSDSADVYFGAVYGYRISRVNASPYEALKMRGFDVISSDSLQLRLIHLYDQSYSAVEDANELFANVSFDVLRPYFLTHFRDLRFNESATPMELRAVVRDPYFENITDYRHGVLASSTIPVYEAALADAYGVIRAIDREIERLR